jgi:small subunit ribosomal protein S27Ae
MAAKKGAKKDAGGKKGAAKATKSGSSKKDAYDVSSGKVVRKRPVCPKCGPGVFMATHADRTSCGKCGYTEFKK